MSLLGAGCRRPLRGSMQCVPYGTHITKFLVSWKKDQKVADNKNIMKSLGKKLLRLPRKWKIIEMHPILSPCLF